MKCHSLFFHLKIVLDFGRHLKFIEKEHLLVAACTEPKKNKATPVQEV